MQHLREFVVIEVTRLNLRRPEEAGPGTAVGSKLAASRPSADLLPLLSVL